jgi:uncharacterized protein
MKMKNIKHHNTNRLNHMNKVSYYSYKIAKYLRLDYEDVAVGGLLHDFYTEQISECDNIKDKVLLYSTKHPLEAVNRANSLFNLTEKEQDIIKTHMFPVDYRIPRYAESWIVSLVDKALSISEFGVIFKDEIINLLNKYIVLIINMIG